MIPQAKVIQVKVCRNFNRGNRGNKHQEALTRENAPKISQPVSSLIMRVEMGAILPD